MSNQDQRTPIEEDEFITPQEAAKIARVHVNTIWDWLNTGKLPGFQACKRGKWRISKKRLMSLLGGPPQSQNGG